MDRINRIFFHPLYQKHFQALQEAEKDRIFCNHTLSHFLDTARLMYIRALEEQAEVSRELIYAAAFLHDIGRYEQISRGISHELAGAELAAEILPACGFSERETQQICFAISCHRQSRQELMEKKQENSDTGELLARYLYDADKQTRCCFSCPAAEECNWPQEKRNLQIRK